LFPPTKRELVDKMKNKEKEKASPPKMPEGVHVVVSLKGVAWLSKVLGNII
jgi:hypothetical protein